MQQDSELSPENAVIEAQLQTTAAASIQTIC